MTPLETCDLTLENTQRTVDKVRPDDLDKPTPCSDWTVRTLVNHMIEVLETLERPAHGEAMTFNAQGVNDVAGSDPAGAFRKQVAKFIAAWGAPGATERLVPTMLGEQPAAFYLGLATADMLLHGWDLATAIGVNHTMNEEAASSVLSNMQSMLKPEMRGPDKAFAEEVQVGPNASTQERLLAFSGRNPRG